MHPNGIAVSKDGTTLFVSLTGENQIVKIGLKADGSAVGAPTVFAATGDSPDGLAVDGVGNVYVATNAGVEAYSASGTKWGALPLPSGQVPTSLAFGGADSKTLFVGSTLGRNIGQAAIYKLTMREAGLP
jgi:gluconolactonase